MKAVAVIALCFAFLLGNAGGVGFCFADVCGETAPASCSTDACGPCGEHHPGEQPHATDWSDAACEACVDLFWDGIADSIQTISRDKPNDPPALSSVWFSASGHGATDPPGQTLAPHRGVRPPGADPLAALRGIVMII